MLRIELTCLCFAAMAGLGACGSNDESVERDSADAAIDGAGTMEGGHDSAAPEGGGDATAPGDSSDSGDASDASDSGDAVDSGGDSQDASGGGGSFAEVQAVFDTHCVICHDAAKIGLPAYGALPLTQGASYDTLVNAPAHETCGGTLVVPGNPDRSYLFHKLTDATPCDGLHMPRAFEVVPPAPLTDAELSTVRSWIEKGAPR